MTMGLAQKKLFAPLMRLFGVHDDEADVADKLTLHGNPPSAEELAEVHAIEALTVLDYQALERTRAMMGDKFGVFIRLYLKSAQGYIDALREVAGGVGSVGDAVIPAHSLKSSAAQVGAIRVAHLCRMIEDRAQSGVASNDLAGTVQRLDECCRQVEPRLLRAIE
jgi:HPt (histidine-containing phosphotransfer) domain-containing protein